MNVFTMNESENEIFRELISHFDSGLSLNFRPLNRSIESEWEPDYHLFLLDAGFANSEYLHERMNELRKRGAHDRHFLFVIKNKESISSQNLELVVDDLKTSLQTYLVDPVILTASINGQKAYVNDEPFEIWNHKTAEYQSFKKLKHLHQTDVIERYTGFKELIDFYQRFWRDAQPAFLWSSSDLTPFIYNELPAELIEALNSLKGIELLKIEDPEIFAAAVKDRHVLSVAYIPEEGGMGGTALHAKWVIREGEEEPMIKKPHHFVLSTSLYRKRNHPHHLLLTDPDVVVTDREGFPVPKTSVVNFKEEVIKMSGYRAFLTAVEEEIS
ncbi:hypothetical protein [Jeotgalibacillus proteolyticus]|uniref:hypothetical protein n=1 Tax=Jeotgalibacillus proteolyticus TaxID=2082395 RepID=UPI003CE948A0